MNYLKCSKENGSTNYGKNKRIVYDIFFCHGVVKRREQLHYFLIILRAFNNVLPSLEISDQIKKLYQQNELNFIYLIFKNKLIFKMIDDSHE